MAECPLYNVEFKNIESPNIKYKYTIDPWITQGLGDMTAPWPSSSWNIILQLVLCILNSISMDSTNHWSSSTVVFIKKKITCKWTHAVQTHVLQGSTAYTYLFVCVHVYPYNNMYIPIPYNVLIYIHIGYIKIHLSHRRKNLEDYGGGDGVVTKLCPTLATPWAVACQASVTMGFSRQEYWSGLPFPSPGDLPDPGIEPGVSCIAGRFFTNWAMREAWKIAHKNKFFKVKSEFLWMERWEWLFLFLLISNLDFLLFVQWKCKTGDSRELVGRV